MINFAFNLRTTFQKLHPKHWQYLILASLFSFFSGLLWFYFSAITKINLGILIILFGLIQGFLAYLFMNKKGEAPIVFFSLFFSLLSLFIGKYLFFEQYYDWFLSAYVDKSALNIDLIIFYFHSINIESLQLFREHIPQLFSFADIFWTLLMIALSLQYLALTFEPIKPKEEETNRIIFRKRRFD